MKDWQRLALNFKYQDGSLVERLYNEFMAAEIVGVSVPSLVGRPRGQDSYDSNPERTGKIIEAFKGGATLSEIGLHFGLTRERVRQILKKRAGLSRMDGGEAMRMLKGVHDKAAKAAKDRALKEENHFKLYGCSIEFVKSIAPQKNYTDKGHPIAKFVSQKRNASKRGIGWDLTFKEWWDIWQESGKWDLRGRGQGYCMARHGDTGPYSKGNVEIITIGQNFSDSYISHPWEKRFNRERSRRVLFSFSERMSGWQVTFGKAYCGLLRVKPYKRTPKWLQ